MIKDTGKRAFLFFVSIMLILGVMGFAGAVCGDSVVEAWEVCDGNSQGCTVGGQAGMQNCNSECSGWNPCVAVQHCGDGIINDGEECDDGFGQTASLCGLGACTTTIPDSCVNCMAAACVPGTPTTEICINGIDDDCDGFTDEGCGGGVCDENADWKNHGDYVSCVSQLAKKDGGNSEAAKSLTGKAIAEIFGGGSLTIATFVVSLLTLIGVIAFLFRKKNRFR